MSFVTNAWYAAGWDSEIGTEPLARRILDQPVVFYRTTDGTAVALYDACPHRFAPLSLGRVTGDVLVCGYHGLAFGEGGRCRHNPHGKGTITSGMSVRSYPVTERYGLAWIWMGDPALAAEAPPPSIPSLETPDLAWVKGLLHVSANYQLVIDNLLDLTHVEYLHPFLSSGSGSTRLRFRAEQDGDVVSAIYDLPDEPVSPLFRMFWTSPADTGTLHTRMDWTAPATLSQNNLFYPVTEGPEHGVAVPLAHILTPETEESTHYFWLAGRAGLKDNEEVSAAIHAGITTSFGDEDEPMVRAVRSRMTTNDLLAMRPAALPMDEAAIRARRVIARLLKEQDAAPAAAPKRSHEAA